MNMWARLRSHDTRSSRGDIESRKQPYGWRDPAREHRARDLTRKRFAFMPFGGGGALARWRDAG